MSFSNLHLWLEVYISLALKNYKVSVDFHAICSFPSFVAFVFALFLYRTFCKFLHELFERFDALILCETCFWMIF